ncbi:YcbX family protein [Pokkaliibacter sp. CJK22405]|uniref:YcbX family protein n=1 Tax=Pokkaliibacter sp. CJK22405 TaxID=3384615 RepID=UPI0039856198
MKLAEISVYPIKSCQGVQLSEAWVAKDGLSVDRRWMVVDADGKFITGRSHSKLTLIKAHLQFDGLMLQAPGMSPLALKIADFSDDYKPVTVWSSHIDAQCTTMEADAWLSEFLGEPVHLRYQGPKMHRPIAKLDYSVSFADGFPLLLTTSASLAELQRRSPDAVPMERFRTNLVIDGTLPFEEDDWVELQIGEVRFANVKPCARCVFTTLDPHSQSYDEDMEPLATLQTFRQDDKGEVYFGVNLIALNTGSIRAGDDVRVLVRSPGPRYPERPRALLKEVVTDSATHRISLSGQGSFEGSGERPLLDQIEQAGMELPSSCRAGICGACKVKLIAGQVSSRSVAPLSSQEQEEGMILSCCSYPLSDVELASR